MRHVQMWIGICGIVVSAKRFTQTNNIKIMEETTMSINFTQNIEQFTSIQRAVKAKQFTEFGSKKQLQDADILTDKELLLWLKKPKKHPERPRLLSSSCEPLFGWLHIRSCAAPSRYRDPCRPQNGLPIARLCAAGSSLRLARLFLLLPRC